TRWRHRTRSCVRVREATSSGTRRWRTLLYFAPEIRKRRGKLAAGGLFGLVYALSRVIEPWPLKIVFDQVLFGKPAHGLITRAFTFLGTSPYELLAASAVVLMLTGLVRGVAYYYED